MDTIDPGVFSILVQCMFSFRSLDSSKAYHILQRGTKRTQTRRATYYHMCCLYQHSHKCKQPHINTSIDSPVLVLLPGWSGLKVTNRNSHTFKYLDSQAHLHTDLYTYFTNTSTDFKSVLYLCLGPRPLTQSLTQTLSLSRCSKDLFLLTDKTSFKRAIRLQK